MKRYIRAGCATAWRLTDFTMLMAYLMVLSTTRHGPSMHVFRMHVSCALSDQSRPDLDHMKPRATNCYLEHRRDKASETDQEHKATI